MLGGEDDVADASEFGEGGPIVGVEFVGVEGFGEVVEEAVGVIVGCADEGVADDRAELGIEAPVDEEAEALIAEPFDAVGMVVGLGEEREGEEED